MPMASFLIPMWKVEPQWIHTCLESINNQTYSDWDCYIVSDGCPDEKILEDIEFYTHLNPKFKLMKRKHRGIVSALNTGLGMIDSRYVLRLDSDDFNVGQRLEKQITYMEANPKISLLGGHMCCTDGNMEFVPYCPKKITYKGFREALSHNSTFVFHPTFCIRREAISEYSDEYQFAEDVQLICKFAMEKKKIWNLPEILVAHRLHPNRSSSLNGNLQRKEALRAIDDMLGRNL